MSFPRNCIKEKMHDIDSTTIQDLRVGRFGYHRLTLGLILWMRECYVVADTNNKLYCFLRSNCFAVHRSIQSLSAEFHGDHFNA